MNYIYHMLIYLSIYAITALGLNVVVGYCGLLTLAHAGYFAIGSYTYAICTLHFGWGFLPSLALGVGIAVLLSTALSVPAWRFKGDLFVMVSLAVQAFLFSMLYNWANPQAPSFWGNLTNGPYGLAGIPPPVILGIKLNTLGSLTAFFILIALGCIALIRRLLHSPWGRMLKAMRDDELALRGLGKDVRLAKLEAFAISCAICALAGVMYASYVSYINPSVASLDESILILCMVLVGGIGNIRGPLFGALVLLAIPETFRLLQFPSVIAANARLLAYGLLLILMTHFRPQGLVGDYKLS